MESWAWIFKIIAGLLVGYLVWAIFGKYITMLIPSGSGNSASPTTNKSPE